MFFKSQLSSEQAQALAHTIEDWELTKLGDTKARSRLAQLAQLIGEDALHATQMASTSKRWEEFEKKAGWPPRTGKVALRLISDFLITIHSERDTRIY